MSSIILNNITFYYKDSSDMVFEDLTLNIDTGWNLGLTGRNGRGKSTFLNLISGILSPVKGEISSSTISYNFPYIPKNPTQPAFNVIKESIAPFSEWEKQMDEFLKAGDEKSLKEYGELLEVYQRANGYEIDSMIEKEFIELGMNIDLLKRDFSKLSGGEQTRALIIPLFLKKDSFPLIDEPTNHLDMNGRILLGEYLSQKKGFIVASHDRNFLDLCIDHVLSINKSDVSISKGNYSQWKYNMNLFEEFERRKYENIKREVKSLETSAKKRRVWADSKEKEKAGAYDKGYIGHKSAKQMKRALNIEHRIVRKLDEKRSLMRNAEYESSLKIKADNSSKEKLLSAEKVSISFEGNKILENISFEIFRGDRTAITGNNGCGKTSLIRALKKEISIKEGYIHLLNYIKISYAGQNPCWVSGMLRDLLAKEKIDETKFRNILGTMGAWGEIFERPLETFSKGELKKVELCRSFLEPFDLLIWDEPLNYLDIISREQLEEVILKFKPTILFTEHDKEFIKNVATDVVNIN